MKTACFRVYQVFLAVVAAVYCGIFLMSTSGLLIAVVSALVGIPTNDPQVRSKLIVVFCAFVTLPATCIVAVSGTLCLYLMRYYLAALLPLLLPLASIALINAVIGTDIRGVMGW